MTIVCFLCLLVACLPLLSLAHLTSPPPQATPNQLMFSTTLATVTNFRASNDFFCKGAIRYESCNFV